MKKIIMAFCFGFVLLSLFSCSFSKDITDSIVPYFSKGSSFNCGFEFDSLSGKAKVSVAEDTLFKITSEGASYGTELRYTDDSLKISYGEIEFTQSLNESDPFFVLSEVFGFLSECRFDTRKAETAELDGASVYLFELFDGEREIRFIADKATHTPLSVETHVNGKSLTVYFRVQNSTTLE